MFFPNPFPEAIFRGSKCQPILKNTILEPFSISNGSQKRPLERHFRPKSIQKRGTPSCVERPGGVQDATCDPKRPRDRFLQILDKFWPDVGAFLRILNSCCIDFGIDFATTLHRHFLSKSRQDKQSFPKSLGPAECALALSAAPSGL